MDYHIKFSSRQFPCLGDRESGVAPLIGDFNSDQRDDIALVRQDLGWTTVPVAFAQGSGNWNVINKQVGGFAAWAGTRSVTLLLSNRSGNLCGLSRTYAFRFGPRELVGA